MKILSTKKWVALQNDLCWTNAELKRVEAEKLNLQANLKSEEKLFDELSEKYYSLKKAHDALVLEYNKLTTCHDCPMDVDITPCKEETCKPKKKKKNEK